jgi:hypothetical protein
MLPQPQVVPCFASYQILVYQTLEMVISKQWLLMEHSLLN